MLRCFFCALAFFSFLVPAQGVAEPSAGVHLVRAGETLAAIAKRYYGKESLERILVAENGLSAYGGSKIAPGMTLLVPHIGHHRAKKGDTWRSISEQYYGDAKRAFLLIEVNQKKPGSLPDEGSVLVVPYPLRHVASQRESLNTIAELYYGSSDMVGRILRFNRISSRRISRGDLILVPLADLKLSEEGRRALYERARPRSVGAGALEAQERAKTELALIADLNLRGEYVAAVARANRLESSDALSSAQTMAVQLHLAEAYVALGREKLALSALRKIIEQVPTVTFPAKRYSPKVRELAERVRKSVGKGAKQEGRSKKK